MVYVTDWMMKVTINVGYGQYDVTNRLTVAYQKQRACPATWLLACTIRFKISQL